MEKHFLQNFSYQNNPYFSVEHVSNNFSPADNIRIGELVNSIDSVISFLTNDNRKNTSSKFRGLAGNSLNELRNILNERSKENDDLNKALNKVLDGAINYVLKYIEIISDNSDYNSSAINGSVIDKVALLKEQGYLEFEFDQT
jgi:hypothetical protein